MESSSCDFEFTNESSNLFVLTERSILEPFDILRNVRLVNVVYKPVNCWRGFYVKFIVLRI